MTEQEELWERIRAGDRRVFEGFYHAHAAKVLLFLCRMTGNRHASEDITQEVFLELWKRPNGFNPTRGTLINYVFGMARKRGAEWWRSNIVGNQDLSKAADMQAKTADETSGILIEDAFSKLNAEDRSLLWLREIEGHSYAELAVIFGVPIGTIRSRLFAAREELRRLWKTI